jgi:hypothetical protein
VGPTQKVFGALSAHVCWAAAADHDGASIAAATYPLPRKYLDPPPLPPPPPFTAELLPPNDGDIMDWMSEAMSAAESAAITSSCVSSLPFINFNLAIAYLPDLGFCVAVDGAMRLARPLPAAAIISSSPPGSMYQVCLQGHACQ